MTGKRRSTVTLKPPPRQAPTLSTPTFKDQMKANGNPSETPPSENEDIAKLLRALNEDLHAEQQDEVEDDEEEPASRGLPLGKIALALLAAGGIAVGVVYLGSGDPEPVTTAANNSSPMLPAPAITRAPQNAAPQNAAQPNPRPANPAPAGTAAEGAPAASATPPTQTPPAQTAPASPPAASSAPPPPVAALPASPPPVLKVPEPPAVPATAPAAAPKPRATAPAESAPPPAAQKPEAPKPGQPTAGEPADTGSLQAMLSPPKDAGKRPPAAPAATPAAPPAPPSANGEAKPPARAATPPAAMPAGRYTVQVGTFSVTANADSLAQRLQGSGFQAYTVDWTDSSNRSWRAVRVGGFAEQSAARREAEQLKTKMGLNPVVITAR
ncbi:SPOR domain-containing protein [Azospirillum ramasamyi]|uniref:SPOR domain-containing protein n=1 Tax=Azospirillum ramasamyi TaxID=682998 RepID=A0A2U9S8R2_9PROT|nr:SPOR domain-containing protein [Azospirillum ramasamyi]